MKAKHLTALLAIAAGPLGLFASNESDRSIEDAANASYNYRTVLAGRVAVTANDGVVTLTGTVQDKDDKSLAEETVKNLPGVVEVKNEIDVKPDYPENSDSWIAFKVHSRLLVKANVSAVNTTVAVKDGVVTLGGTAENPAQKELTAAYVKDVEGVKSVRNEIAVKETPVTGESFGSKIDDASITSQVKFALLANSATSVLNTKVTTIDGVVVITGQAGSDAEKSLVTKLAEDTRGVRSVNNNMTVRN